MQSKEIIEFLKRTDASDLISANVKASAESILYGLKSLKSEEKRALLTLINIYRKAEEKLPEFIKSYPALTEKAYEQSSSEVLAKYKASLVQGKIMYNLSGGIGIDDLAFCQKFNQVFSIDSDRDVHDMANFNLQRLPVSNIIRIHGDASAIDIPPVDLIYVDPDRRVQNKRSFHLDDATPDIVGGHVRWLELAPTVLIKLSPMADLTEIRRVLSDISEIHVISLDNEVKEVLVKLSRNVVHPTKIYAVILTQNQVYTYPNDYEYNPVINSPFTDSIFVESAAALIKSDLDKSYFGALDFKRCGPHAAFYIGKQTPKWILGRAFRLIHLEEFTGQKFSAYLKSRRIEKAHVKKRDFPMESEEIKKKYKLKDGGEDYFFFYTSEHGKKEFVHARKPIERISLF